VIRGLRRLAEWLAAFGLSDIEPGASIPVNCPKACSQWEAEGDVAALCSVSRSPTRHLRTYPVRIALLMQTSRQEVMAPGPSHVLSFTSRTWMFIPPRLLIPRSSMLNLSFVFGESTAARDWNTCTTTGRARVSAVGYEDVP